MSSVLLEEKTKFNIQIVVYTGFPAVINDIFVAKEVFNERDKKGIQ